MGKVLVTGAPGFIGGHVTRMLVESGREVRALARPGEDLGNIEGLDVEVLRGDLLDLASLERALDGVSVLYHLAAIYAIWLPKRATMFRVNVEGTKSLLELALQRGLEKVVYTSSIAAVGVEAGKKPATETTPFNQWEYANDYILSKYISQLEVLDLVRRGLPCVLVNPAFPFGWGDVGPTPTGQLVLNILNDKYPGAFDGGFNVVDVEDVARGHLLAEEKGKVGETYLLAGENLSVEAFMRLIAEVTGCPDRSHRKIPVSVMATAGSVFHAWAEYFTKSAPRATRETVMYASQYLYYDAAKAERELGFSRTPVRKTIDKAARWFRSEAFCKRA